MKYSFTAKESISVLELLSNNLYGVTTGALKRLLSQREIKVEGVRVSNNVQLKAGERVEIFLPSQFMKDELQIVYEDDNILVVNKPPLMTVEGGLMERLKGRSDYLSPVHRLDTNTTGLVVLAKTQGAEKALLSAFKERRVKKLYHALVVADSNTRLREGEESAYIFKDERKGMSYVSDLKKSGYKEIKTGIKIIAERGTKEGYSILEVELSLLTGRTHQLRAHLKHLNAPILGDDRYGIHKLNKSLGYAHQQLKAVSVTFEGMEGELAYLNSKNISIEADFNLKKLD